MDLNRLLEIVTRFGGSDAWVYQVFLVVFVVLVFNFVLRIALDRVFQRLRRTENPWDDAFLKALGKPLNLLVWVVGIAFAAQIAYRATGAIILEAVIPIRDVGVIAALTWFLIRFINGAVANVVAQREAAGKEVDRTTTDAISRLLRLSVLITAALVALQTLGFSISGVLAFGGIGGIAVGFAAKDLLANFFGGMMVFLDRPFAVGDWIRSPDRDIEGTVEHIGWRRTCIRTFDKRPLYVPNSVFNTIAIQNPSRMTNRRIYETIGIRYDDIGAMEEITTDVRAMLAAHPDIDDEQTMMVYFNAFGASSLDFFVYTFTRTTVWAEYHKIKHEILLRIHKIIAAHGAEIAFPTSTVHLHEELLEQIGPKVPAVSST